MVKHIPVEPFDKNIEKLLQKKEHCLQISLYRQIKLTRLFLLDYNKICERFLIIIFIVSEHRG